MLIVDANHFNIEMLRELVLTHGNACDIALSGKDAVNIISSRFNDLCSSQKAASMYKLILVDYTISRMNGFALVKRIKELMSNNIVQAAGLPSNTPYICCCSAYDN